MVMNSSCFMSSRDRLMPWSGTGSWVTGHAGQGSADWWVTWVTVHKMWPIVSSDLYVLEWQITMPLR